MAVKPIVKTFEYFLDRLLRGFKKDQGREPNNLEMILIRQEAGGKARDAAKVIEVDFGKPFKQEMEDIKGRMSGIKSLSDELVKMSKGYDEYYGTGTSQKYKEKEILEKINKNNKEAIRAFKSKNPEKELMEDVDFPFDGPDDPKKYYTGGMVDVEPSLSDIGHGSDSLMARTRLISPNNQATTSTGLNYLLAEDNDNIRVPFANGNGVADEEAANARFAKRVRQLMDEEGFDMGEAVREAMKEGYAEGGRIGFSKGKGVDLLRRGFLKTMGAAGAGIAALKTGLLSIGKGADAVKNIPPIKTPVTKLTDSTTQMPDWFPSFINKFRDEGKAKDVFKTKKVEVSKEEFDQAFKEGKGENYYTDVARTPEYKANNPDHMDYYKTVDTDERIYTTYTNDKVPGVRVDDMDGNVDVMFENDYSQPVSMNYTAPGKRGPETGRADVFVQGEAKLEPKPKGEFVANDVEVYATDPDGGSEAVDVIADTVDDMLEGKTRQMEEYVTGKKTKLSRGEERVGEAEFRAELAAEEAAEAADDFASGGIARMLGE